MTTVTIKGPSSSIPTPELFVQVLDPPYSCFICCECGKVHEIRYCDGTIAKARQVCDVHKNSTDKIFAQQNHRRYPRTSILYYNAPEKHDINKLAWIDKIPYQAGNVVYKHTGECLYLHSPISVVQGEKNVAPDVYFRLCSGEHVNGAGQVRTMDGKEGEFRDDWAKRLGDRKLSKEQAAVVAFHHNLIGREIEIPKKKARGIKR